VTVENVAAAKVFFECHYNCVMSGERTPRSLRRHKLERILYDDLESSPAEKNEKRRSWAHNESDHLRETRVMKTNGLAALKGKSITASRYEIVKVLGKGSFGVVRLVREKPENE
jgi:protein-serine/threonine kinase